MEEKKRGRPFTGREWARQRAFRLPSATDARLVELAARLGVNHTQAVIYAIDHARATMRGQGCKGGRPA